MLIAKTQNKVYATNKYQMHANIITFTTFTMNSLLNLLKNYQQQNRSSWAVLIDPDKTDEKKCLALIEQSHGFPPDFFFVGSSLLLSYQNLHLIVNLLKTHTKIPVILFPGSYQHLSDKADAVLFLSLISGRNADYLIGNQVLAAPLIKQILKQSNLEVIPTGYMLIESGRQTSVGYISNTMPIPHDKNDIAMTTALAGQYLGLQLIYLEAGSGAEKPVSSAMIRMVKQNIDIPLIVGGGIRTAAAFQNACDAGANVVVTGNILEQKPELMRDFYEIIAMKSK